MRQVAKFHYNSLINIAIFVPNCLCSATIEGEYPAFLKDRNSSFANTKDDSGDTRPCKRRFTVFK